MSLPKNTEQSKTNPIHSNDDDAPTLQCSQLTARGRSAIAVIAVQGPNGGEVISNFFSSATKRRFSPGNIYFGSWNSPGQADRLAESVVVTPLPQGTFEIHCHGGVAAVQRILDDLKASGVETVAPERWNQRQGLLIHEAEVVLGRCATARTAAIAMDQVRGALAEQVQRWIKSLRVEGRDAVDLIHRQSAEILATSQFSRRMTEPIRVVLAGPPNVGKSSLLNAVVGFDRSITMDAAGTTRDVLHADTVINGLPIRLSDTAGIRDAAASIESDGITRARNAAAAADLVVWVDDPTTLANSKGPSVGAGLPTIYVRNKSDLDSKSDAALDTRQANAAIETSALSGAGIDRLMTAIAARFDAQMPPPGAPVAVNRRQATLLQNIVASKTLDFLNDRLQQLLGVRDAAGDTK